MSQGLKVSTLTVVIQREVILGVAELLRSARDENVVVTKEILKASNLLCRKTKRHDNVNHPTTDPRSAGIPESTKTLHSSLFLLKTL